MIPGTVLAVLVLASCGGEQVDIPQALQITEVTTG
jgi:hypothetical protein